ncbi:MAG: EamA family transporter [endosymbiont of Galathealinum brachiosum]|uniref:EamA family transporter n=1 Tax=endosymbiont of Galathealinum brachiosum TaxID=2200906 RepID=A0A370DDK1_9GAMM|nr:MAG: EamA family transporter [endosymbiont of Galathealinum brachiosum]
MLATSVNQTKYHKLIIASAFIAVILIWSTTPITIKWSGEGVSYLFGIVMRMSIGTLLASFLVYLKYKKLALDKSACKVYFASAVAIFGGMMPVYWGAQYISSGLISVVFGLSPIVTGYLAWRFIHEQSFNLLKILGAIAGLSGLVIIFYKGISTGEDYILGIIAVLVAVVLHSASAVWIKSIKTDVPPLSLVAGGLLFSMPLFLTVYLVFAPPLPEVIPLKAIWSIVYLGIVGSVIGFVSYYYLLKHLPASSVALITLVTPVAALWIGNVVNNELISFEVYAGTAFVLIGLALHQGEDILSKRLWIKRKKHYG